METIDINSLLKLVENGRGHALDLGCGAGRTLNPGFHYTITGLDQSPKMAAIYYKHNNRVVCGDALFPPFKNAAFSLILAIGLSEYLQNLTSLFKTCANLTHANGYLLLTTTPSGIFGLLRYIGGHVIYLRKSSLVTHIASQNGFSLLTQRHSFTQDSFLFTKTGV